MSSFPCEFDPMGCEYYDPYAETTDWGHVSFEEPNYSSETTSESELPVATTEDCCITTTDIKNLKAVVQAKSNYNGEGQLSSYLKNVPGLIILPLHAITFIRKPVSHHRSNPQALVYFHSDSEAEDYPNLEHMIEFFQQH